VKAWFLPIGAGLVVGGSWAAALRFHGTAVEANEASVYGRDEILVCVSGSRAGLDVRAAVNNASREALLDRRADGLGLDGVPLRVLDGCPDGHFDPPAGIGLDRGNWPIHGVVEAASELSTVVFVVAGDAERALGGLGYVRTPYEAICVGHVCAETTTALFVAESLFDDPDALREALIVGLGIDPNGNQSHNGHPDDWEFSPK